MPEFTASPIVSAGGDPAVFDASQHNSLLNLGLQQDLTDRATYRSSAAGLLAGDPDATAQAMGANPQGAQAYLSSLPAAGANMRAQTDSDTAAAGSLAAATLNAPPDQRAAVWTMGRQALINGGHQVSLPTDYPGDAALQGARNMSLPVPTQLDYSAQIPSVNPVSPLRSTPGGGYLGPGGAQGQAGGGIASTPLPASGQGGYTSALANSEGGNNPSAVNAQGYAGQFQFGTGRLTDLGMYQPAPGENPNSNSWHGTLNIPGYPQVKTLADFRGNVSAQNAVQAASQADIGQAISQTPGAQNFDPNGLQAVAHLGGVAGMQKFVATNGAYNPADANGTHLSDYYRRFSSPGGQAQPAGRVQVASAANSTGMAPTATDASPGVASPPSGPAPGTPQFSTHADERFSSPSGVPIPGSIVARSSGYAPVAPPAIPTSAAAGGGRAPAAAASDLGPVSVDTPAQAAKLPAGSSYRVAGGPVQTKASGVNALMSPPQAVGAQPAGYGANGDSTFTPAAPNALMAAMPPAGPGAGPSMTSGTDSPGTVAQLPAPPRTGTASLSPSQAVQQATNEYGDSLQSMDPAAANLLVQQRAQQLLNGGKGSAPPASTVPNALLVAAPPASTTPNVLLPPPIASVPQGGQPATAGAPNALLQVVPGIPGAPVLPQQGSQQTQGASPPSVQGAPQQAYPFLRNQKTMALLPVPEQPGYAFAQGPGGGWVAQRIPGTPGAGVDVQNVAGHQYVTDKQTGAMLDDRPIANAMRVTTIPGPNGTIVMQGNQQVATIPFSTQPAQVAAYQRDSDDVTKVAQQNTAAEQSLQQTLEARNLAQGLPTGSGGEGRAALASWLKTYAPDSVYQGALETGFVPDSPRSEQLAKILLRGAATDEQQLGGSGGLSG